MMLKKLDLNTPAWELFDQITIYVLKGAIDTSKAASSNQTDEDKKYNKELRKALKVVLKYFGEEV